METFGEEITSPIQLLSFELGQDSSAIEDEVVFQDLFRQIRTTYQFLNTQMIRIAQVQSYLDGFDDDFLEIARKQYQTVKELRNM